MKNPRTWIVWLALAFCAATILGAMTWQTGSVLRAENERGMAEARADLLERMRLALWRMDALGTAWIVEEAQPSGAENLAPLPVKIRFVWHPDGRLTVDEKPDELPALRNAIGDSSAAAYREALQSMRRGASKPDEKVPTPSPETESAREISSTYFRSNEEYKSRSKAVETTLEQNLRRNAVAPAAPAAEAMAMQESPSLQAPLLDGVAQTSLTLGPPKPLWIGDSLFLFRKASGNGADLPLHGVWIDSDLLSEILLDEVKDLLPHAELVAERTPSTDGMVLASLPLRLEAHHAPMQLVFLRDAVLISLSIGWLAAGIAIASAALLIFGVLRLSERRAAFVSAVTHELRTPLTTFRLYADMLEAGAVKPEKRGGYLRVLAREADRLSHLVENVLAFSRIERGSARSATQVSKVCELLAPLRERFETRLSAAGLSLEMDLDAEAASRRVKADAAAVEHILFNLIDNAAKYASPADPSVVRIDILGDTRNLRIAVTDHGPGIPAKDHRRIFKAFHKSARDAAETRPGVGLGLALSRRLARSLGGDLSIDPTPKGTRFVLRLPGWDR